MERVRKLKEMFSFDLFASGELRMQVSGIYKHREKVQVDEKSLSISTTSNLFSNIFLFSM